MRGFRRGRATLLGGTLTLLAGAGTVGLAVAALAAWPGTGVVPTDTALAAVALTGATAVVAWLTVVLALASVTTARSTVDHPSATEALPRPVRVACALLVALAGSTSVPALATSPQEVVVDGAMVGASADGAMVGAAAEGAMVGAALGGAAVSSTMPVDHGEQGVPQPGWTPTAPVARPAACDDVGLVSTQPHQTLPDQVVVRHGDTLWDIAARHLGPGASLADIAAEWPRWYAENAHLIGPDPDLIAPGLELTVPHGETSR